MAREGISYEAVEAVATGLAGAGQAVTLRAVREKLGTGSMNTVSRHLQGWREARPTAAAVIFEMPAELVNAFGRELRRGADQAVAGFQAELLEARAEVKELAGTGEALEAEREALVRQVVDLTTARDQAEATARERTAEISRLTESVEREQRAAESARIEAATSRLKLEGQSERLDELRQSSASLRADLTVAEKARVAAEQVSAVAQSQVQAEGRRADQSEARERVSFEAAGKAQTALVIAQTQASASLAEAERRTGSAEARATVLADQLADIKAAAAIAAAETKDTAATALKNAIKLDAAEVKAAALANQLADIKAAGMVATAETKATATTALENATRLDAS